MRQTTLSVSLEVEPASQTRLTALIDALHDRGSQQDFSSYLAGVPLLHFMSLSVFPSPDYDPLFVIEVNFDGPPGPFWGQIEAAIGSPLRDMLRCCKRPLDDDGALYDYATGIDAPPVAPYLERRASRPSVFHHGNRRMERGRIVAEGALFTGIRAALTPTDPVARQAWRVLTPAAIHARLRTQLLPDFAWLSDPAPVRRSPTEYLLDVVRLFSFAVAVLLVLTLPGLIGAGLMSNGPLLLVIAVAALAVWGRLWQLAAPLTGTGTAGKTGLVSVALGNVVLLAVALTIYAIIVTPIVAVIVAFDSEGEVQHSWLPALRGVAFGIGTMILVVIPGLVVWLRWLERRDTSQDAPPIDDEVMRQMAQREDWIPQNHMGSIVLLRPGLLRGVLVRVGHLGLHLGLRLLVRNGYLGSMRTIHFAHWAFVGNGGRLMFHSNFDQSWESYLDDFIEKAHEGLTLAWGSGVGFPPTRLLIQDGASHGRKFKAWARHSMAISRFWFSAYPTLTVDQIERNNRIATGLCRSSLNDKEAAAWIADL